MSEINRHNFEFSLPMFPHERIDKKPGHDLKLQMDGKPLEGVTSLCVKAGSNGFTNVAIEFEASCAVKFVGHLMATIQEQTIEDVDIGLAELYQDAVGSIDPEEYDTYRGQAQLVRRIVELLMERIA